MLSAKFSLSFHLVFPGALAAAVITTAGTARGDRPEAFDDAETPRATDIAPALQAAEGLEVRLWASSPLLHNPTSLDIDERGRVWVAEGVNYRGFRNKDKVGLWRNEGDRIVILEDRDGDGTADTSTVFVENDPDLVAPLGVTVIGDKVLVACSPHLLVYTRDEENRMTGKEILLTGFGGHNHDHSLHKAQAGPDGRIYFNVGNAGPHVVTDRDGWTLRSSTSYHDGSGKNTPGMVSDDGRVHVAGLMLSVAPDGSDLQVLGMGARNPYGTCVDSFGEVWTNDNDDTFSCRTTWWMRYGNSGYSSRDGRRTWAADRRPGQNVRTAHWRQEDPGVIPSGHVYGNGSPTGITHYENGALGQAYDGGLLLSCEAGQNVVWAYRRKPDGAGFALEAIPFLTSTGVQDEHYIWKEVPDDVRKWFRPSDITVGTDGAVYLTDWFDGVVGGHQMVDTLGEGAIYRVVAEGTNPQPPKLADDADGAMERLLSPAENVRATGLADLRAIGDAAPPRALYEDRARARLLRARGLWAAGLIDPAVARDALDDPDPEFRLVALRLLERTNSDAFHEAVNALVDDESPAVLRELCLAVRDQPLDIRRPVLRAAAARYIDADSPDRWLLEAIGTGAEPHEAETHGDLLHAFGGPSSSWSNRFADLACRLHPSEAVPAFKARALDPDLPAAARRQALDALAFIPERAAAEAVFAAAVRGPKDLRPYAAYWIRHRETHHWAEFGLSDKLPALGATPREKAERFVKQFHDAETTVEQRTTLAREMARFSAGAIRLARLLNHPKFPDGLEEEILPLLLALPDPEVTNVLSRVRPEAVASLRDQTDTAYPVADVLRAEGDPARGRELYFGGGTCASCHAFDGEGSEFGPDLTATAEKFDSVGLIDAIIRPNDAILVGYEATRIDRRDGTAVLGFVEADDDPLVLRDASGERHVIPRADIARRTELETSLMPPMSALLNARQVADIVAFLQQEP
jgi:putative membrane-bound dehydrogenase-like protein